MEDVSGRAKIGNIVEHAIGQGPFRARCRESSALPTAIVYYHDRSMNILVSLLMGDFEDREG